MASINFTGLQQEIKKFAVAEQNVGPALERAVKAGAKVLAEQLSAAAPVRTGQLAKSIKPGKVSYSPGDGYHCEVSPTGNNKEGEPLAKIGNILEYGRSNMSPRPWFFPTVAQSEGEVVAAMRAAFEEGGK